MAATEGVMPSQQLQRQAANPPSGFPVPAEIRNRIYEYALIKHDGHVDVSVKQPGITRVCKQARSEALPILYGNNSFVAYIHHRQFQQVLQWLATSSHHITDHKATLFIECRGDLIDWTSDDGPQPFIFDFKPWHHLAKILSRSSVKPAQVRWSGWISGGAVPAGWNRGGFEWHVTAKSVFNEYLLKPLLKDYGFFDPSNPPAHVYGELKRYEESKDLGRYEKKKFARAEREVLRSLLCLESARDAYGICPYYEYLQDVAVEYTRLSADFETAKTVPQRWEEVNDLYVKHRADLQEICAEVREQSNAAFSGGSQTVAGSTYVKRRLKTTKDLERELYDALVAP